MPTMLRDLMKIQKLAHLVEQFHSKEYVMGSIPILLAKSRLHLSLLSGTLCVGGLNADSDTSVS